MNGVYISQLRGRKAVTFLILRIIECNLLMLFAKVTIAFVDLRCVKMLHDKKCFKNFQLFRCFSRVNLESSWEKLSRTKIAIIKKK